MTPFITSILDSDLYKFTMQQAVLVKYPDVNVTYQFKNRGDHRFNEHFLENIKTQLQLISEIKLTDDEYEWLKNFKFFKPAYLEYLKNYRFDPNEVDVSLVKSDGNENNDLSLSIRGPWHSTILWEVPLMAIISELYFTTIDCSWDYSVEEYAKLTLMKDRKINHPYAEFGTRRRRSYDVQDCVVKALANNTNCFGTSNVHLAMKYGLVPTGTMAHEFIMGISVLEGLRHANRHSMDAWSDVYRGDLGITLTDTYGTKDFFEHFDMFYAKLFDGVRHDSGCPFKFADQVVDHYKKLNIDPCSKTIIFSDGLDSDVCVKLNKHCENLGIKWAFGIGTNFTNDKNYFNNNPLNMVIKLRTCNGGEVVKLSDDAGKATGDEFSIKVARKTFKV